MKTKRTLAHLLILSMLMLSACNLPIVSQEPDITDTPATPPTETPIPNTNTPEFTSTPEFTATPSIPVVSVSVNTNCRTGPGTQYDLNGGLNVGQTAEVIGKNSASGYWIIKTTYSPGYCWLWGQYATVSGNTTNLPEYPVPPTPTPTVPTKPENLNAAVTCTLSGAPFFVNNVKVKLTWSDTSNNEDGFRVYRNGSLIVTLPADSTVYTDDTTLPAIWVIGNPPPSHTYDVRAYNTVGQSNKASVTIDCVD